MFDPDELGQSRIRSGYDRKFNAGKKLHSDRPVKLSRDQTPYIKIKLDHLLDIEELKHLP